MTYYLFTATESDSGKSENFLFNDAIENRTFSRRFVVEVSKKRIYEYLKSKGKNPKNYIVFIKTISVKELNRMSKKPKFINPHDECGHPHLPDKIRL